MFWIELILTILMLMLANMLPLSVESSVLASPSDPNIRIYSVIFKLASFSSFLCPGWTSVWVSAMDVMWWRQKSANPWTLTLDDVICLHSHSQQMDVVFSVFICTLSLILVFLFFFFLSEPTVWALTDACGWTDVTWLLFEALSPPDWSSTWSGLSSR